MSYADYDYDSDDDYYETDGDYIWAEDGGWELADELASGAVPDPPALYYREEEWEEHDKYDFWSELEYGNGDIYDGEPTVDDQVTPVRAGEKRKRSATGQIDEAIKRTRLAGIQDYPPVLWKPARESFGLRQECPLYKKPAKAYALLPDWRERFKDAPRFAATVQSDVPSTRGDDSDEDEEEMGAWEDTDDNDDEQDDSQEDMDEGVDLQDIDPEMLRTALAAKLTSSGLAGADQAAFMDSLMKMMSGDAGGNAEDALGSLTSALLNQVSQGGADSSAAQWLSGQGVSLEDEGDEEGDADQKETATDASTDATPQDEVAAEKPTADKLSAATQDAPLPNAEAVGKKRKQISFQAATPQPDDAVVDAGPSSKRARKATANTAKASATVPVPAKADSTKPKTEPSKPDASQAARATEPTKPMASWTKTSKPDTPEVTEDTAPAKTMRSQTRTSKPEQPPPDTEGPKQNNKRKATSEAAPEEKPKRQLRNFAAPTASSQSKAAQGRTAETKTTRSGKTRK